MSKCMLCPRHCGADREIGELGYCRCGVLPKVARSAPHYGEEPCISGTRGSGAVFFSGCNMQCVFCQNREISFNGVGETVSVERLADIFLELQNSGVHNINLVSGTHYIDKITESLKIAKLDIPVVWNCGGYESVDSLRLLEGLVQIYMPDFKYTSWDFAKRYSGAEDYPNVTKAAILEMYRQVGNAEFDDDGLLLQGLLIRHLILPGRLDDCFDIIDWVSENFADSDVLFSLMSQFTPLADFEKYPELARRVSLDEYDRAQRYLELSSIELGYTQDLCSATDELIPDFDGTGVRKKVVDKWNLRDYNQL